MKSIKILAIMLLITFGQTGLLGMSLMDYAQSGDIGRARELITAGAGVDEQNVGGNTALHAAVVFDKPLMVKLLLSNGANPNLQDSVGNTALFLAAGSDNLEIIELLVNANADLDLQDSHGRRTALMAAILNDNPEIVKLLLDNGANLDIQSIRRNTALILAAIRGNIEIIKSLIGRGADIDIRNNQNKTATDIAREKGMIGENETLVSWYLNNYPYSNPFLRLFESRELTDIGLPYGLRAHTTILRARIPNFTVDSLRKALEDSTEEQSVQFLRWIYIGLTENEENVKEVCNRLAMNFDNGNSIPAFRRDMQTLYNSRDITGDFTIVVKENNNGVLSETIVRVHKVIMAARSGLYKGMFTNIQDVSNRVTDRSELSLPAVDALIEFIYTGQITNLTEEIANELLEERAALFFQLPEGELEEYLERARQTR